jgi:hypothetical protein
MAYTKVIPVHTHLSRLVDYAADHEKTGLDAALSYVTDPEKTERRLYECAINCALPTAFEEMQATKKRCKKAGGRLAYHIIQSFAEGEVTPQQAHEIGIEYAQRVFGDRYEIVIGTHLNKEHLHNHLVVNSVSFVDGKKYRDNFKDFYEGVYGVSNDLCRENGLSVIESQGRGKHYAEWQAERKGKPTIRPQVRAEVDEIISHSFTFKSFVEELKRRGYIVKQGAVKHMAVFPPFGKDFIRLDSLGAGYAEAEIRERLARQQQTPGFYQNRPAIGAPPKRYRLRGKPKTKKLHGFIALYYRYLYLLRKVRKRRTPFKVGAYMREELLKFDRYAAQFKFLSERNIVTPEALSSYLAGVDSQVADLTGKALKIGALICPLNCSVKSLMSLLILIRGLNRVNKIPRISSVLLQYWRTFIMVS